jgi:group I intron endonuclease
LSRQGGLKMVAHMSNKSGIYQIKNLVSGKLYVGSAVNIARRWNGHVSDLNAQKHRNQILQRSWDKYGCNPLSKQASQD